ncbi:hypothetical protein MML48_4g00007074 [Holotrichia oblita]|uniref:Uncharacterized protein n=1 Tax=Holotrichia oblita TaxID=644536 RepID=A0ACB9T8S1_HOLOL|nr:hypothetical protein MML48_4g00007074 [Holotrichia oblita]
MEEEDILIIQQILEDLNEAEEEQERPVRRFYNREDAFEISDIQFIKLFRLNKPTTREVINIASEYINEPSRKSATSVTLKVLIALHFYGHGTYQTGVGKTIFTAVSQSTVSRAITEVTNALNEVMAGFIHFPQNFNELRELRHRFFRQHQFPGVVGCVDGTHVAIVRPAENEHIYVNRKQYHSLNVQLVCDEKLQILHVNAKFPGSCHDSHVWRESNISTIMETIYRNGIEIFFLLGDSGYPLRPWLLTPLDNPLPNSPEERCNNRLMSIRSLIERCNGLLKNRFRCLLKHRVLHYQPDIAGKIVNACVVLHNMCINNDVPEVDMEENNVDYGIGVNGRNEFNVNNTDLVAARQLLQTIADTHFQ